MLKTRKKPCKKAGGLSAEEVSILIAKPRFERNRARVSWPDQKPVIQFEEEMPGDSE